MYHYLFSSLCEVQLKVSRGCLSSLSVARYRSDAVLKLLPQGTVNVKAKVIGAKVSFALMEQTSRLNNRAY